jgi:hypothetical protein
VTTQDQFEMSYFDHDDGSYLYGGTTDTWVSQYLYGTWTPTESGWNAMTDGRDTVDWSVAGQDSQNPYISYEGCRLPADITPPL